MQVSVPGGDICLRLCITGYAKTRWYPFLSNSLASLAKKNGIEINAKQPNPATFQLGKT